MQQKEDSTSQDALISKSSSDPSTSLYCYETCTKRGLICSTIIWLLALLALLLTIFLGAGSIAQTAVDDSTIYMYKMTMSSFGDNYFVADISGGMDNRSPFEATIKQTSFDMRYGGSNFGKVTFPKIDLKTGKITPLEFDEEKVKIVSQTTFDKFSTALINSKSVIMTIHGTISLQTNGLSYSLHANQDVELLGMQGLSAPGYEPTVEAIYFTHASKNALKFAMLVRIYNPSIVAFSDIQGMNFTMLYLMEGVQYQLGYAFCTNDTIPLNTGSNYYMMEAVIIRTDTNSKAVIDMVSSFAEGREQTYILQGNADTTPIKILQQSMQQLSITVTFAGLDILITDPIPPNYLDSQAYNASPISTIVGQTLGSYILNRPLDNENSLYQAVFANMDSIQILTYPDYVNCNYTETNLYLDTILSIYNPMNETMTYYEWGVRIFLILQFDSFGEHFDNPLFATGKSPKNHDPSIPVFSLPAFSTTFYTQRICLEGDSLNVAAISFYLATLYGTTDTSFSLEFLLAGEYSITIGDFAIQLPYNQSVASYNAFINIY